MGLMIQCSGPYLWDIQLAFDKALYTTSHNVGNWAVIANNQTDFPTAGCLRQNALYRNRGEAPPTGNLNVNFCLSVVMGVASKF